MKTHHLTLLSQGASAALPKVVVHAPRRGAARRRTHGPRRLLSLTASALGGALLAIATLQVAQLRTDVASASAHDARSDEPARLGEVRRVPRQSPKASTDTPLTHGSNRTEPGDPVADDARAGATAASQQGDRSKVDSPKTHSTKKRHAHRKATQRATPERQAEPLPPFDPVAVRKAVDRATAQARGCHDGDKETEAYLRILLTNHGHVQRISMMNDDISRNVANCVVQRFQNLQVPAYEGKQRAILTHVALH